MAVVIYSWFQWCIDDFVQDCGVSIGRWLFQCIGYDYMAYMDYMDLAVCCSRKAIKLNHSLTTIIRACMDYTDPNVHCPQKGH